MSENANKSPLGDLLGLRFDTSVQFEFPQGPTSLVPRAIARFKGEGPTASAFVPPSGFSRRACTRQIIALTVGVSEASARVATEVQKNPFLNFGTIQGDAPSKELGSTQVVYSRASHELSCLRM
jgi:hypothetical protein